MVVTSILHKKLCAVHILISNVSTYVPDQTVKSHNTTPLSSLLLHFICESNYYFHPELLLTEGGAEEALFRMSLSLLQGGENMTTIEKVFTLQRICVKSQ